MANTYLTRTQGSPTNNKIFTVSCWFKASQVASEMKLIYADDNSTNNYTYIHFSDGSGRIRFQNRNGGSNNTELIFQNYIRDFSAWYHLVIAVDSTQSTASNRVKFYLNGTQYTDLDSSQNTYPPLNQSFTLNSGGYAVEIGANNTSNYFQGSMTHFHFIDGLQYQASDFGESDSVSGIWKPKTAPSVTYGTNGFFLKFENSGAMGTDSSGNSNTFTVSGNLTQNVDTPSSNMCTWNTLNGLFSASIQSNGVQNGNTYVASTASNEDRSFGSTLAFTGTGKYYMEFKVGNLGGGVSVGIGEVDAMQVLLNTTRSKFSNNAKGYAYLNSGSKEVGGSGASYGNSFTSYDYIGIAYNNGTLWFSKNGTWQNSATATEIANGTTTNSAFTGIDTTKQYFIMWNGFNDAMIEMNAGQGYFRTTAISSPNNPTSGDTNAKFKYAVPTGLQPLTTKGINSF